MVIDIRYTSPHYIAYLISRNVDAKHITSSDPT